jgi:hypothetical protein
MLRSNVGVKLDKITGSAGLTGEEAKEMKREESRRR